MQRMRIKTQVILGAILLITAFTGIKIPVSGASVLSPLSLGAAIPAKAASILPQTGLSQAALPIIDCETCHDSTMMMSTQLSIPENEQSSVIQNHPGSIVQCVFCHAETPKINVILMGEPE